MAFKIWRPKPKEFKKPPVNPALDALRLKRGEIKEIDVTNPKVLELARITPYQELVEMARPKPTTIQRRPQWYSATGEPEPTESKVPIEALKSRYSELRRKSKHSLKALLPSELAELDYIMEQLRKAGVTYIGTPPRLRQQG